MAYAVSADITDRYGANYLIDAADRDDDDAADATAVTDALDDSTSEMDSFIAKEYPLPLATVPAWMVRCCVDLAVYHLASEGRGALTEEIVLKYDRWLARLQLVAEGKLALGLAAEPDTHYTDAMTSNTPVLSVTHTRGLS